MPWTTYAFGKMVEGPRGPSHPPEATCAGLDCHPGKPPIQMTGSQLACVPDFGNSPFRNDFMNFGQMEALACMLVLYPLYL